MGSKKRKKKAIQTPKHKRMKRADRLDAAKHWIISYTGIYLVQGYKNHFAVDLVCAIQELTLLGVKLDTTYVNQVRQSLEAIRIAKDKKRRKQEASERPVFESDETFSFIVGYTEGGFPFGVAWEEQEELERCGEEID